MAETRFKKEKLKNKSKIIHRKCIKTNRLNNKINKYLWSNNQQ